MRLACLLTLLLAASAWAQPAAPLPPPHLTSDLHEPDLTKAWDLTFVAEGYQAHEEDLFLADARRMAKSLQTSSAARPMRETYTFNYHFVFAASRQAVSWRPGGKAGDTRCRSFVDREGVLVTNDPLADALAVEVAPDVDSIVIVAKLMDEDALDPNSFGELAEFVDHPDHVRANADMPTDGQRVRQPALDPQAFVHELGHALFGLGDEYGEYDGAIPESVHWEIALTPNLTTDPSGARWRDVTDEVYEGGGYYATGVYRPAKDCRMRASRSKLFCEVCEHAIRGFRKIPEPAAPALQRATRAGERIEIAWEDLLRTPLYYAVELYDTSSEDPLWDDYVEGHLRAFSLPVPPGAQGKLEVRIYAVNALDQWSDADWRFVATPGATVGFTGAIGN